MMFKKALKVLICGAVISATFLATGCSAEKKKVLKIGTECGYAPYNWSQAKPCEGSVKLYGSSEYAYGYDIIIAKKLAEAMGCELELHKIEWDGLPPAVVSGKVDAVIAGMAITPERKATVDFTIPYYRASIVGLVRRDSPQAKAQSVADLRGAVATSQLNTIWYDKIDQVPDVKKLPAIDSVSGMLVALKSGKCNLLVVDIPCAKAAEFANPELMMLDLPAEKGFQSTEEEVCAGIALRKGNTELLETLNSILSTMTESDFNAIMEEAIRKQPLLQ